MVAIKQKNNLHVDRISGDIFRLFVNESIPAMFFDLAGRRYMYFFTRLFLSFQMIRQLNVVVFQRAVEVDYFLYSTDNFSLTNREKFEVVSKVIL